MRNRPHLNNSNTLTLGLKRNGTGSVFLWTFQLGNGLTAKYLLTGDATIHSMFYMAYCISQNIINPGYVMDCILTAPHHGADLTSSTSQNRIPDWTHLEQFLDRVKPNAIAVSAGLYSHHGHPGIHFIQACLNQLIPPPPPRPFAPVDHTVIWCTGNRGNYRFYANNMCDDYTLYTTVQTPIAVDNNNVAIEPPPGNIFYNFNNVPPTPNANVWPMPNVQPSQAYVAHRFNGNDHQSVSLNDLAAGR